MNKKERRIRNAKIVEMSDSGLKISEIAEKMKLCKAYIWVLLKNRIANKDYKEELPKDQKKRIDRENKINKMAEYYKNGWTLERIGQKYGMTRERVRQLLKGQGLHREDGGMHIQMIKAQPAKDRAIQRHKAKVKTTARKRVKKSFGCSLELWEELGGHKWTTGPTGRRNRKGTVVYQYLGIKRACQNNNYKFKLSLQEWWDIWTKSEKFNRIGTKRGQYCMARINKNGPYAKDNVKIVLVEDSKIVN